jgi:hypothetical protein
MIADPQFPNLPFISDAEWAEMTEPQKFARHVLEVAEAAKVFAALQGQRHGHLRCGGEGADAAHEPERLGDTNVTRWGTIIDVSMA